jgi:hypothetical protein
MDPKRIQKIEKSLGAQYDSETVRILTTPFSKLNHDEKLRHLDERMTLLRNEYQNDDDEICDLFDLLDKMEKYEDMLIIILHHTTLIGKYYNDSYTYVKYNLQYKWDKDITNFNYMTLDQWLNDLKNISMELEKYNKLKLCVVDKILTKHSVKIPERNDDYLNKQFDFGQNPDVCESESPVM